MGMEDLGEGTLLLRRGCRAGPVIVSIYMGVYSVTRLTTAMSSYNILKLHSRWCRLEVVQVNQVLRFKVCGPKFFRPRKNLEIAHDCVPR
jgi:hypothetical protein